ncbi:unnamed protein product [Symbiodinium microadriaticum]|nr:unnamed protein product [Symbiodinium microadriaticum]
MVTTMATIMLSKDKLLLVMGNGDDFLDTLLPHVRNMEGGEEQAIVALELLHQRMTEGDEEEEAEVKPEVKTEVEEGNQAFLTETQMGEEETEKLVSWDMLANVLLEEGVVANVVSGFNVTQVLSVLDLDKITPLQAIFEKQGTVDLESFVVILQGQFQHVFELIHLFQLYDDERRIITQLVNLFDTIDVDCTGNLTWEEFTAFLVDQGMAEDVPQQYNIIRFHQSPLKDGNGHQSHCEKVSYLKGYDKIAFVEQGSKVLKMCTPDMQPYTEIKAILDSDVVPRAICDEDDNNNDIAEPKDGTTKKNDIAGSSNDNINENDLPEPAASKMDNKDVLEPMDDNSKTNDITEPNHIAQDIPSAIIEDCDKNRKDGDAMDIDRMDIDEAVNNTNTESDGVDMADLLEVTNDLYIVNDTLGLNRWAGKTPLLIVLCLALGRYHIRRLELEAIQPAWRRAKGIDNFTHKTGQIQEGLILDDPSMDRYTDAKLVRNGMRSVATSEIAEDDEPLFDKHRTSITAEEFSRLRRNSSVHTLRLKIAQKPYMAWSLGPKALKYESLEP